jgi:AAA+ ATPase superfamily predicted ATPase
MPVTRNSVAISEDFFPLGLASYESFCNREEVQAHLKANIRMASPTLVTSPRRYGKTSLVLYVIQQMKLPFACVDLYAELDEFAIQNAILNGIGEALYAIASNTKKALKLVTDFFAGLNISFNFEGMQVKVEIAKAKKTPAKVIMSTLEKLDATLAKEKKKVILFFDEFQRLAQVAKSTTIEGALRHVAQQSKNICFIFSGSNRHLLGKMFDDSIKPFYNLCDRIILDRISEKYYIPFIQEKAKLKWNKHLHDDVIALILDLTKRHPYYLNVLCHRLWLRNKMPTESSVLSTWDKYAQERKSDISAELDLLSENQAKMLIAIAKYGKLYSPISAEFIALTKFPLSSASVAVKSLQKLDCIYADEDGRYRVLDPVIEYLFA